MGRATFLTGMPNLVPIVWLFYFMGFNYIYQLRNYDNLIITLLVEDSRPFQQ